MTRQCERPGCSAEASVLYGIDPQSRFVWLDFGDLSEAFTAGVLCRRHADAMVVPRGWSMDDRRQPVPRLFIPPAIDETSKSMNRPQRRRKVTELEVPGLFDTPIDPEDQTEEMPLPAPEMTVVIDTPEAQAEGVELDDEVLITVDDDETKAHPWVPTFDGDSEFKGLLNAKSKLLGRAFGLRSSGNSED